MTIFLSAHPDRFGCGAAKSLFLTVWTLRNVWTFARRIAYLCAKLSPICIHFVWGKIVNTRWRMGWRNTVTRESHDFYKNHYIQIHFEKYLTTIRDNLRFSNNISPNLLGLGDFPQKT